MHLYVAKALLDHKKYTYLGFMFITHNDYRGKGH